MNIRPFEIGLIGVFVVAAVIGLIYLANYKGTNEEEAKKYGERVVIWGTLDRTVIEGLIREESVNEKALEVVEYVQIDPRRFENELVNAIAEGRSPDLVIIPHTLLVTYRTKLLPLSLEGEASRIFKDSYIDGAEIFLRSDGIYGIPFAVDPLVMYWNRDIFSSSGLALPPKTWETILSQTTKAIVRTDDAFNITQSAIAFGEAANVAHAKDVLAMLFLQAGSDLVTENEYGYRVTLNESIEGGIAPGDAVLPFYTQFVNPSKDVYSWNRSLPLDRTQFLNGRLAMYFGKGSEEGALERENANLNFDIAQVPQGSGATVRRDYGDFYAFVIPQAAKNKNGAYGVATYLGDPARAEKLANGYGLAPVHRALFEQPVQDPFKNVIYQSALIARGWLDPSPVESEAIFKTMIEEVSSGRNRLRSVVTDGIYELESLLK